MASIASPAHNKTALSMQASSRSLISHRTHQLAATQQRQPQQQDATAAPPSLPPPPNAQANIEDAAAKLDGFRLYAVAIGVCFGSLMMSMDISIIGTVRMLLAVGKK